MECEGGAQKPTRENMVLGERGEGARVGWWLKCKQRKGGARDYSRNWKGGERGGEREEEKKRQ